MNRLPITSNTTTTEKRKTQNLRQTCTSGGARALTPDVAFTSDGDDDYLKQRSSHSLPLCTYFYIQCGSCFIQVLVGYPVRTPDSLHEKCRISILVSLIMVLPRTERERIWESVEHEFTSSVHRPAVRALWQLEFPAYQPHPPAQRNSGHGTPCWGWRCLRADICPTVACLCFHVLDVERPWTLVDKKHLADSVPLRVEVVREATGPGTCL